jgi:hypothetical protein
MKNYKFFLEVFLLCLSTLTLIFVRSFQGVYLKDVRIGEVYVAIFFVLTLYYSFKLINDFVGKNNLNNTSKAYLLIILSFFLSLIFYQADFLSAYNYKSGSYILVIASFFLAKKMNIFHNSKRLLIFNLIVSILVFFFSVIYYPNILRLFFEQYADKFEMHTGADILLVIILLTFSVGFSSLSYFRKIIIISLSWGFYYPLIAFKSRSALVIFTIFTILYFYQFIKKDYSVKKIVLFFTLFLMIFNLSIFLIGNSNVLKQLNENTTFLDILNYRNQPYLENQLRDDGSIPFLYIYNSRVYSGDGNFNWRLQIWQDVYEDTSSSLTQLFFGIGYSETIPAMNNPDRRGIDGLNENVHNSFVNIFARGGVVQLLIFIYFYISIVKNYKSSFGDYWILLFLLPILANSLFTASMENSHFPIIFYYFLGIISQKKFQT